MQVPALRLALPTSGGPGTAIASIAALPPTALPPTALPPTSLPPTSLSAAAGGTSDPTPWKAAGASRRRLAADAKSRRHQARTVASTPQAAARLAHRTRAR